MAKFNVSLGNMTFQNLPLPSDGDLEDKLMEILNSSANDPILHVVKSELTVLQDVNHLRASELIALIAINTVLMLFGAAGALIMIAAVVRKPRMRTPRTLFTVNLAVSDLTLCLFTQPFNLIRTLSSHYEWKFGEVMCKFTSFAQAANVFVATMSITVIALDRFNVIVHPFRSKRIWSRPLFVLPVLWLIAFVMAMPMLAFSTVSSVITFADIIRPRLVCVEAIPPNPGLHRFKYAYGIFILIFQYLIPIIILVAVYIRICTRIRSLALVRAKNSQQAPGLPPEIHVINSESQGEPDALLSTAPQNCMDTINPPQHSISTNTGSLILLKFTEDMSKDRSRVKSKNHSTYHSHQGERRKLRLKRQRRANILLTCISLVFAISWLPLHAVNIFMDYKENTASTRPSSTRNSEFMGARQVMLIQSACLLCILFSCCVNPLLYGYLNENYRKEFADVLSCCCCCCCSRHSQRGERV
ncbi:hypothetical protein Aperf_G00000090574 [Anoplocephala perfoliata]